jgi:leucyl-tRNA synthetase
MILGENNEKMSKSRGNVINPDAIVTEYGADSLRLYEMFMGPLEQTKPWSMSGVEGLVRFLGRVWRLVKEENPAGEWVVAPTVQDVPLDAAQLKVLHATIKKVTEDIESLSFNTALAQMMILVNALIPAQPRPLAAIRPLLQLLNPFAPHITEELAEQLRRVHAAAPSPDETAVAAELSSSRWPEWDPNFLIEDEIEIPVQVNGKVRAHIRVKKDATSAEIENVARQNTRIQEHLAGKTVRKVVVVPGKLVNFVAM